MKPPNKMHAARVKEAETPFAALSKPMKYTEKR